MSQAPTEIEIQRNRESLGIPPEWVFNICDGKCGDWVWHPPVDEPAAGAPVTYFCSSVCVLTYLETHPEKR